jgi:RNA 3'-terminal phosphate cyclase (ATP)
MVITKIRGNRPRGGGLANQHLTGLNSVVEIVPNCLVKGNAKGSTFVHFEPGEDRINSKKFTADIKTPGAIALILQMLTPCLLFQKCPNCVLSIKGGTHVGMSPTIHPI